MVLSSSRRGIATAAAAVLILCTSQVLAHEHHTDNIPEGEGVSVDPIDTILWMHILIQTFAWGILFPTGMVLGMIKSRWHVPVQILGAALAVVGYFLGHKHKGRQFAPNVHSAFAPWVNFILVGQVGLGVYLKLHLQWGFLAHVRRLLVLIHGVLGKALPVIAWVQMLFGGIVALGFCRGDHVGQCAAHFIMGSAFIAYGILLTIILLVGQAWLRRSGRSQEFYDSSIIAAWGCVNTFTEHRWGGPWVKNDLQHTSMGIIWWAAGLVGIWLSRKRDGTPKRNLVPAIVIFLTGYGMSGHPQELMISTEVHKMFGYTLMVAGIVRIVEISFVLRDRDAQSLNGYDPHSFQYLTPFLLYSAGFLFMGATEEQMSLLAGAHVTHVSYILILFSFAFLLFLFVNVLLHIYALGTIGSAPDAGLADPEASTGRSAAGVPLRKLNGNSAFSHFQDDEDDDAALHGASHTKSLLNGGSAVTSGLGQISGQQRRQMQEAQEFELDALISDEDDEDRDGRVIKPGDAVARHANGQAKKTGGFRR